MHACVRASCCCRLLLARSQRNKDAATNAATEQMLKACETAESVKDGARKVRIESRGTAVADKLLTDKLVLPSALPGNR